jgi:ABC-type bacteriocin/lantibiotic exporter with double-glycine peptidase domain
MIGLIFFEAILGACVTYLVIQIGKSIATDSFTAWHLVWLVLAQAGSYFLHTISWIFGEQAGFRAFAFYLAQFTRDNRYKTELLNAKDQREVVEPFLTNETFHLFFELMYELEGALQLFFGLILSALVLGSEIDGSLPIAYAIVFVIVMMLQFAVRRPVMRAYLNNQKMTNRMTAQTYTAWDNIFSGNLYNFKIWQQRFKVRLIDALKAQVHAILLREGISSVSGMLGLIIVFSVMAWVVAKDANNMTLLLAMATTLPKQIDMTHEVHSLAIGWNDLLALWTRAKGVVDHMDPKLSNDEGEPVTINERIKLDRLQLRQNQTKIECTSIEDALAIVLMQPTGRINVRGQNGSGKSSLLVSLRAQLKSQAYYWPTADRLAFNFSASRDNAKIEEEADDENDPEAQAEIEATTNASADAKSKRNGYSSGEQQLASLREIVSKTNAKVYLLDEWDANLDPNNRAQARALIDQLATRARVVEISHRDA